MAAAAIRLLLVEDDLGLAELIGEELSHHGWSFRHAGTGRDALAELAAETPDLVLLDYSLPDMNAFQILEAAEMPPFMVTTGAGDERVAVEMMKRGAMDYLVKDARFLEALPAVVARCLDALDTRRRLKETEESLRLAEEGLRQAQKMESLGRMAGGIAHDFNNLFQTLMGNLEAAHMKSVPGGEAQACLDRALKVLDRATLLARQMLDYSGKSFRRSEAVDLNRLMRDGVESLRGLAGLGPSIHFQAGPGLPRVEGDPDQLTQVLEGLVLNAREALPADGPEIRVATALGGPGEREQGGGTWVEAPLPAETYVVLSVEDAGVGMAEDVLERAFDPFFTTHRPGRGMGLAAVLGILRGHNAGLWVRSAPGEGTQVRILFVPYVEPAHALPGPGPADASRRTLLLVDDDEDLRETLAEFLGDNLGYRVIQAADGVEAVEACRREGGSIGLILMDATMPRMTGAEAYRVIRAEFPGIRALLCSGYAEEAGTRLAQEYGFLAFLKKPFSLKVLEEAVAEALA